jgi:hypothetical protein
LRLSKGKKSWKAWRVRGKVKWVVMKFHAFLQGARQKLNAGSEGTPTSIHMIGLSERGKPGTQKTPLQGAVDGKP